MLVVFPCEWSNITAVEMTNGSITRTMNAWKKESLWGETGYRAQIAYKVPTRNRFAHLVRRSDIMPQILWPKARVSQSLDESIEKCFTVTGLRSCCCDFP